MPRRSDEDLRRLIALGPKAVSTNVLGYDLATEIVALRELVEAQAAEIDALNAEAGYCCGHGGKGLRGCDMAVCRAWARTVDAQDALAELDALGAAHD